MYVCLRTPSCTLNSFYSFTHFIMVFGCSFTPLIIMYSMFLYSFYYVYSSIPLISVFHHPFNSFYLYPFIHLIIVDRFPLFVYSFNHLLCVFILLFSFVNVCLLFFLILAFVYYVVHLLI